MILYVTITQKLKTLIWRKNQKSPKDQSPSEKN